MDGKAKRGFASMSPAIRSEIASLGGKTAHAKGLAHTFSRSEAKAAGSLGGASVSRDRAHMAEIGRLGGRKRGENARARKGVAT